MTNLERKQPSVSGIRHSTATVLLLKFHNGSNHRAPSAENGFSLKRIEYSTPPGLAMVSLGLGDSDLGCPEGGWFHGLGTPAAVLSFIGWPHAVQYSLPCVTDPHFGHFTAPVGSAQ